MTVEPGAEEHTHDVLPSTVITEEFRKAVARDLSPYRVGIIGERRQQSGAADSQTYPQLLGSGTLIKVEDDYGILTAHHVMNELHRYSDLGLVFTNSEHHPTIPVEDLSLVPVARGKIVSQGPDLAVIFLPTVRARSLEAFQSFYNLTYWREKVLKNPPKQVGNLWEGPWFIVGFPDEYTRREAPYLTSFQDLSGMTTVRKQYQDGDFDYLEVDVKYDVSEPPPLHFGGTSGGGLWYVPLSRTEDGKVQPREKILAGVVFFQTERTQNVRYIRCHGWLSIYEAVYKAFSKRHH